MNKKFGTFLIILATIPFLACGYSLVMLAIAAYDKSPAANGIANGVFIELLTSVVFLLMGLWFINKTPKVHNPPSKETPPPTPNPPKQGV